MLKKAIKLVAFIFLIELIYSFFSPKAKAVPLDVQNDSGRVIIKFRPLAPRFIRQSVLKKHPVQEKKHFYSETLL